MKIRFINEPTGLGYAYFAGEEATLPDSAAKELIADGYAVEVTEPDAAKPAKKAHQGARSKSK